MTRTPPAARPDRIARPAVLLPVLLMLGVVGGWYLIPAGLAWLLMAAT